MSQHLCHRNEGNAFDCLDGSDGSLQRGSLIVTLPSAVDVVCDVPHFGDAVQDNTHDYLAASEHTRCIARPTGADKPVRMTAEWTPHFLPSDPFSDKKQGEYALVVDIRPDSDRGSIASAEPVQLFIHTDNRNPLDWVNSHATPTRGQPRPDRRHADDAH